MYVPQLVLSTANKQLLLLNMKAKIITLINDLWIIPDLAALSAEHLQKKRLFPHSALTLKISKRRFLIISVPLNCRLLWTYIQTKLRVWNTRNETFWHKKWAKRTKKYPKRRKWKLSGSEMFQCHIGTSLVFHYTFLWLNTSCANVSWWKTTN